MRMFIAIDLPEEAKEELRKAQKSLKGGKFSLTKDFHITLKFLGEITPDKVYAVKEGLKQVNFNPFHTKLNSIGLFPGKSKIRIVWIDVSPEEEIAKLQKEIDEKLKELFPKEKDFKSHITIARVKSVENKKELIESINSIKIEKIKFQVNEFKLKKSTLTREGPVYEDMEVFGNI